MADSSPDSLLKGGKYSAPGFRFHPTDEELVMYYLKRKICRRRLRVDVIGVVDVYKMDPEELPGHSLLKTGDRQWFYFTPRSRKYPNAARSSRGTQTGYWKATGRDRTIEYNSRSVGLKKTLVFYRGRAPGGERTDWVMHEYTMDEEELGRCKTAQDYYALYKLFKKSGAGPKNGEQYGALFREEEWVDDDNDDENTTAVPVQVPQPVVRYEDTCRLDERGLLNPVNLQLEDIDALLNGIPDALGVPPRCNNDLASGILQVNSEEELQSTLMNNSARDFLPDRQPYQMPSSFDALETNEVMSAPKTSGVAPLVIENDDFIEVDDLLNPELGASSTQKTTQFSGLGEYDDYNDFDQLFHDVSMSLDMEPIDQITSTDLFCPINFANKIFEQTEPTQQVPQNQLNNIMDPSTSLNQFNNDAWFQDDQAVLFDEQQSFSETFATPSSGVIPESTNPTTSVIAQDQQGQNGEGTTNQFSSALWALMDSIPSPPAYACEGPLNQTFVRMSSFSRIRFKANGTQVTNTIKKNGNGMRNKGFLLLSTIGALCAILWVFLATVRDSGRTIFS